MSSRGSGATEPQPHGTVKAAVCPQEFHQKD